MLSKNCKVVCLLGLLVFVLQIVAIATPNWGTDSVSGVKITSGLWKGCVKVSGSNEQCVHLPPAMDPNYPKNSLDACRAFVVMGAVLVFLSMLLTVSYPAKVRMAASLLLAGGLSSLLGTIIWATDLTKIKDPSTGTRFKMAYGYSYYLNLVAALVAIVVGVWKLRVKLPVIGAL